jgi:glucosyl-3-phosphoglycerate synthase
VRDDVRSWFARRSSHAADWPAELLVDRKRGATVSVVLPPLNEAATVGRIVARIRADLVDRSPLVDELVVMDSGSTDTTAAAAAAAGARVVARQDVLPDVEPRPGKGEVLWRSLAATTGDVVVFVDADLRDFSSAFVTGLLGPLLTDESVAFVKATYDRPLDRAETVLPAGGGRVTEMVARPLIDLDWPALAGFVQPLGGEYAARRSLLERLPFAGGYGVELGLLVDTLRMVGLDAMAQVDLVRRKHRNADIAKLGRMAAEIWQVALSRLDHDVPVPALLTQYERDGTGYAPVTHDVTERDRPPIAEVPSYAASRPASSVDRPGGGRGAAGGVDVDHTGATISIRSAGGAQGSPP